MKFCWTTLYVKNMKESLNFYQEIAGLSIDRRMKPSPDMEIAFLGSGETQIELICDQKSKIIHFGESISIGFDAGSLDKLTVTLKDHNIPIHSGPIQPNPHIKFLYVLDPNGLKVQFIEFIK